MNRPAAARPRHLADRDPLLTRRVLTACTLLATLMQTVDSTIANVALPYMQGTMSASADEINWVLTSYIIAAAISTAPIGYLSSRFGRTRLFLFSTVGFTIASIFCGMSQTLWQIVLFRSLQGVCGALLVPVSQSVMFEIYPAEKRASAMAIWGMGVQVGPVLGPLLGGWLTGHLSWRWVFYVNVPFGILATVGVMLFLKETHRARALRLDWLGFSTLTLAVGAFQALLDRGDTLDWFSSREIIFESCLAALCFYLFIVQSTLSKAPFFTPSLLRDRNFVVGMIISTITSGTLYATMALLAPYLQTLMNYPVMTTGEVLAPRGLGTMASMIVCGRLLRFIPGQRLLIIGFLCSIIALYQMMNWTPDVSVASIVIAGVIQGVGLGFIFLPITTITFATIPAGQRIEATGISALTRNMGSAVGIAITGALLQSNTQINHALLSGYITPFDRNLQSGAGAAFLSPLRPAGAMLLNSEITRQANIIAYVDDFKLMLILALLALPCVFLVKAPPVIKGFPAAAVGRIEQAGKIV
jgi:DHA2 family multidrug resistance protein